MHGYYQAVCIVSVKKNRLDNLDNKLDNLNNNSDDLYNNLIDDNNISQSNIKKYLTENNIYLYNKIYLQKYISNIINPIYNTIDR